MSMDPPPPLAPVAGAPAPDAGAPAPAAGAAQAAEVTPADQMRATGSGRRKVPLPAGRSQLAWMRNMGALRAPRPRLVRMAEVRRHRKPGDAWMVVRGVVYDVGLYLEYHPGGQKMLLSGAGRDATRLFEKYHPWVNVAAMMRNCVVGQVDGEGEEEEGEESSSDSDLGDDEGDAVSGGRG